MRHEYWRHTPTGQVWAVEMAESNLVGACGPLDRAEVPPMLLPFLSFDSRDLHWIRRQQQEFAPEA